MNSASDITVTPLSPFIGAEISGADLAQGMSDDAVTVDGVLDDLVIWGTPDKVAEELLAFRETTGDFGTLLYAGKDWTDKELSRRSMVLLAEKVLPEINTAIGS